MGGSRNQKRNEVSPHQSLRDSFPPKGKLNIGNQSYEIHAEMHNYNNNLSDGYRIRDGLLFHVCRGGGYRIKVRR